MARRMYARHESKSIKYGGDLTTYLEQSDEA